MSDEYGPPTEEDSMWFHEHVRAAEYPKVKRGDKPMEGQMTLREAVAEDLHLSTDEMDNLLHRLSHEKPSSSRLMTDKLDAYEERLDADEQRARDDERDQFRTDRPE